MPKDQTPQRRLSSTRSTAEFFDVCTRTIERWRRDPDLGFPTPIVINGRNYHDAEELEAFRAKLMRRALAAA
jgi:hypothetical protein